MGRGTFEQRLWDLERRMAHLDWSVARLEAAAIAAGQETRLAAGSEAPFLGLDSTTPVDICGGGVGNVTLTFSYKDSACALQTTSVTLTQSGTTWQNINFQVSDFGVYASGAPGPAVFTRYQWFGVSFQCSGAVLSGLRWVFRHYNGPAPANARAFTAYFPITPTGIGTWAATVSGAATTCHLGTDLGDNGAFTCGGYNILDCAFATTTIGALSPPYNLQDITLAA